MRNFFILIAAILILSVTFTYFQNPTLINTLIGNIGATTYRSHYVSVATGSDTNNGTSITPYKTINKAYSVAQPGDIIFVEPGIYSEKIKINGKNGSKEAPIRLVGNTTEPNAYPILDGGNNGYKSTTDSPVLTVANSSNLTFERLRFKNSGLASIFIDGSHYITIRRNIFDYLKYGVLVRNKSSHTLIEHNEFFQAYPTTSTWTQLKDSKWEGGAYTSFGGAGMSIIRYNYFHDQFNSIYLYRSDRVGNYYDANLWVYRNRFERVVDDPYEPESYAFNNHFFHNSLKDTHRLVSLAPESAKTQLTGPIYVYANQMVLITDPTKEAAKGRENSAYKLELSPTFFTGGVYLFNNSIDTSASGTNGSGVDFLSSTINNVTHINHAYRTLKNTFSASNLTLKNSIFQSDMSPRLGYVENPGYNGIDPKFISSKNDNLSLSPDSPARGKSQAVVAPLGFASSNVIPADSDLGAFRSDGTDFHSVPDPIYVTPPGGEDPSFPANYEWPADIFGGSNPIYGASWLPGGVQSFTLPSTSIPQPSATVAPVPTSSPSPSESPLVSNPPIVSDSYNKIIAIEDAQVRESNPNRNYSSNTSYDTDNDPSRIIFFKFSLPAYSSIPKRVTLNLYTIASAAATEKYNLSLVDSTSWNERTLTFLNMPRYIGVPITQFTGTSSGKWLIVPLPTSILSSNHALSLALHTQSVDGMAFRSRESEKAPFLSIEW